jgi:CheY-specific phosphatase CheX
MNTFPEISAENINTWLEKAVQEIAEIMFSIGAFPSETQPDTANDGEFLVACIGTRGKCPLEVSLFFPVALATQLASISLEVPPAELEEKMINDVAGEFANMVVGAVKSRVSDMQIECAMTVPRTMRGVDNSPELKQKVQAAIAVIRGSAGPRDPATSTRTVLHFHVGNDVLRLESHF